jgi:hypothetical protein
MHWTFPNSRREKVVVHVRRVATHEGENHVKIEHLGPPNLTPTLPKQIDSATVKKNKQCPQQIQQYSRGWHRQKRPPLLTNTRLMPLGACFVAGPVEALNDSNLIAFAAAEA